MGGGPLVQAPLARDALNHGDDLLERVLAAGTAEGAPPRPPADQHPPPRESRLDDLEARLARLESGAEDVPALRRGLVALARAHRADSARIESIPGAVERLVAQQLKRFVEERVEPPVEDGSSLSDDVEGIYKQLDRVAELIDARNAAFDSSLARIEELELSVGRLRRNLERALRPPTEATSVRATGLADPRTQTALPTLSEDRLAASIDAALGRARRLGDQSRGLD